MEKRQSLLEWSTPVQHASRTALYLIYIDEVKYKPPHQEYFWLNAISLPSEAAPRIETAIKLLSKKYFSTSLSSRETEFHAKDIFHGKRAFNGWSIESRIGVFRDLLEVLALKNEISRIEVRLDVGKMSRPEHQ